MSGAYVTKVERHDCPVDTWSYEPREGDVWQCTCGRRWTCIERKEFGFPGRWQRRYWPWPRMEKPAS